MAYTKTNWINGQTPINATNLNKIEQGIEDATITPKTTKTTSDSEVYACNYVNDAVLRNANQTAEFIGYWNTTGRRYRKLVFITDTVVNGWKDYDFSDFGIPNDADLILFVEPYTQIYQAGAYYTESFYSNGCRIQASPETKKVSIYGNGTSYISYAIVLDYIIVE